MLDAGLKPVDRSFEAHWVRPGAATAVRLRPDDVLTVVNRDGGQVAELTVLDSEGGEDAAAIGARADSDASVLRGLMGNGSAAPFLGALGAEGLAADVEMLIGNGYAPGHAEYALRLVREVPGVRAVLDARAGQTPRT